MIYLAKFSCHNFVGKHYLTWNNRIPTLGEIWKVLQSNQSSRLSDVLYAPVAQQPGCTGEELKVLVQNKEHLASPTGGSDSVGLGWTCLLE